MSEPTLTAAGQELYASLEPLMRQDEANDWAGANLAGAYATMLDAVNNVVTDVGQRTPGWGGLFDVANVDASWLPWLSQFVGDSVQVVSAPDVATQRAIIMTPQNWTRGRPSTIIAAAQNTLTGTRTVILNQFLGSSSNQLGVTTLTSETPNSTATVNAIESVLPAWIVLTFASVAGGTYATLDASHSTYALMQAAHTNYADIQARPGA